MPFAKKAAKKTTKATKKAAKQVRPQVAKTAKKAPTVRTKQVTQEASGALAKKVTKKASTRPAQPSKGRPSMANKPASIDDYLSHLDGETKQLLQALRQTILELVPEAEECISYSMPAFRWHGKVIGGFAATRDGGSYYPFSGSTLDTLGDALAGYSRTKSGLHFTTSGPLPRALVKTLLDARMAEVGH